MMSEENELREKKLRGSGGYVYAKVTDDEQKKGNLGGPELFLAGIGRLPEERFSKYFCNKCEKDYRGSPSVKYENPNEDLGEGVILAEKGEYLCATCNSTIAQYRKFDAPTTSKVDASQKPSSPSKREAEKIGVGSKEDRIAQQVSESGEVRSQEPASLSDSLQNPDDSTTSVSPSEKPVSMESKVDAVFRPIQSLIGLPAYDSEALLIGKVQEIGLRKPTRSGDTQISIKITKDNLNKDEDNDKGPESSTVEILWKDISKIGDIVFISKGSAIPQTNVCPSCSRENEQDANFCEDCGNKL